jgi:glycosyltransferase involved in cell wall biosynthesis
LLEEVPEDVHIFAYWDGAPEPVSRRILKCLKLTRLLRFLHLANVLREQQIDVIYDRTYLATLDAAGGCFFRPTPRISCCVVDPRPELELYVRLSTKISWWFARRAYQSANVVLTNSEGLRQRFLDYFRLEPSQVKVFYNLLATVRSHSPTADPSASDDSTHEGFLIVTAGRLHPQKGHQVLLEAVDELVHRRGRSVKLMIFGKGESEPLLRDYVKNHRLEANVTIAGFVAEPRRWYARANLFVLPSEFEGMPNALIEAAADGLPVLSTDCPSGPSEILDQGRCGRLVPVGDSQAMADAIEDAMDHPEEWRARAELARQRVEQMFDPVAGIARLEKLFEEVVGRHQLINSERPA